MSNRTSAFDTVIGVLFIASVITFFGLIYYYFEAYPSVVRATQKDNTHASITLKIGSLCDPVPVLIQQVKDANPNIEIEGYILDQEWGQRVLILNLKKKDQK